jgi:hypothetical protein
MSHLMMSSTNTVAAESDMIPARHSTMMDAPYPRFAISLFKTLSLITLPMSVKQLRAARKKRARRFGQLKGTDAIECEVETERWVGEKRARADEERA